MLRNYDESIEKNHNSNWRYTPDHPYRILIIGGSGLKVKIKRPEKVGIEK